MYNELKFYNDVLKNGKSKGEINTLKKKIKYTIRNILFFKHSKKIANFLRKHNHLKTEVYRYPVLCSKIHRPYISNSFNLDKKTNIIISSYCILDNFFNNSTLNDIYKNGELNICEITGKNDSRYFIKLHLYTNFEKEGEFNLNCYNDENTLLAKLTFSFYNDSIFIGGLQGLEKNNDPNLLKIATKNLYGIFPKKLVIEVLYCLFPNFKKLGISTNNHIYLSTRYKFKKYRKISSDYNEFWKSIESVKKNEFWLLPDKISRKNIEDIPSKKRSLYNNRYSLLDSLKENIDSFLKTHCK